tara:strand:- start:3088 stop:3285 length:198 start_codon:yes stop_codon:yes gene_type:complete
VIRPRFLCDKDIARLLSVSPSFVRVQRYKRKKGEPHFLDLEPRYIGSSPRYVTEEVEAFIAKLAA